jgi:hypothetical protein
MHYSECFALQVLVCSFINILLMINLIYFLLSLFSPRTFYAAQHSPHTGLFFRIFTDPLRYRANNLCLNSSTPRVHVVCSNQITGVVSTRYIKDRPSWRRWLRSTRSEGRNDLTFSPWIICARNKDEASRFRFESAPATGVMIYGVIGGAGVEGVGDTVLGGKPHSTLPHPVIVVDEPGNHGLLPMGRSILPPRNEAWSIFANQSRNL